MKLFINVCCQFTAQVGNTNQGYLGNNGNNGNTGYNNNPNNGNSQAVFQNDANTRVGQQFAPQNNYPNGKQQSLQQI